MTHYDRPPSERVIVPFELFRDPMERLLIVNLKGDPDYDGIELHIFDDEVKGSGLWLTLRMFLSFFRTWTTTYRWEATLSLTEEASMRSTWSRTGD